GALVLPASAHLVPPLWRNADLFAGNTPIPWPTRALIVDATAACDARGVVVTFWAGGAGRYDEANGAVLLIDYQQTPLHPNLFRDVNTRLQELAAAQVPHPQGNMIAAGANRGIICTSELRPFAEEAGLLVNYMC